MEQQYQNQYIKHCANQKHIYDVVVLGYCPTCKRISWADPKDVIPARETKTVNL